MPLIVNVSPTSSTRKPVTRKTSPRKHVRTTISPLLGALTRTARAEAGANPLLLKAFVALDALYREKGTRGAFTVLGQQLVISERLCAAGYEAQHLRTVREAHAAMVRVDHDSHTNGVWKIAREEYAAVCDALGVYEKQLFSAPRETVVEATLAMAGILSANAGTPAPRVGRV